MKKQNDVIDNLIETLKDVQEGFKQAAETVRNPALKALFSDYSQQRSRFATALQSRGSPSWRNQAGNQQERDRRVTSPLDQSQIGDHRRR